MTAEQSDQYQEELNQSRKADSAKAAAPAPAEGVSFPWGMFFVAALFDLAGLIPILNILTEILASLIFWLWQKTYTPKLDPMLNLLVNKIIDLFSIGLWPSNIGMVVIAYIKKKVQSKAESPIVKKATAKLASSKA